MSSDAVIHSAWLFFVSGGLMLAAGALTMLGHLFKEKKLLTFVAGVAFIISGERQNVSSVLTQD